MSSSCIRIKHFHSRKQEKTVFLKYEKLEAVKGLGTFVLNTVKNEKKKVTPPFH